MKIDLRIIYPLYKNNQVIDVNEDVYQVIKEYKRLEKNYREKVRKNKAFYSLDRNDGIENSVVIYVKTPREIFEEKEIELILINAISKLPIKQARRVYMYYYMDLSMKQISIIENVHRSRISASINNGIKNLKIIIKNYI